MHRRAPGRAASRTFQVRLHHLELTAAAPKVTAFERRQGSSVNHIDEVIYTGRTRTLGGRDGTARSTDGRLDVALSRPGGANLPCPHSKATRANIAVEINLA